VKTDQEMNTQRKEGVQSSPNKESISRKEAEKKKPKQNKPAQSPTERVR
jgi:hypothetical protein